MSAVVEKVTTAVAGTAISLLAGAILRRIWKTATGAEPPALDDPEAPIRQAIVWLVLSSAGISALTLLTKRGTHRLLGRSWRSLNN
ncbi:MAG: DUF4235 domain-containing protein [Propionibacteriaceae bacterium]|jgi:hypothetical protein|nr:DUF4235 domain-containing protein [Propionibacteriaceae bacterium]